MSIGLSRPERRTVSLDEAAPADAERCPACGEPLFAWLETEGWGPREDQVIDRCENCGLAAARGAVPGPDAAVSVLLGDRDAAAGPAQGKVTFTTANAASLQAWLGAENWAALRPGEFGLEPTPRAAEMLLARRNLAVTRVRHLATRGMASMWQTLLNLLTFHRDFATEALSGRLRPGSGRGRAAFAIDVLVTILAAIPTAALAVLFEGGAVIARRGGVIEVTAEPRPG